MWLESKSGDKSPYIIAEIGNNHLGSLEIAKLTIDAAVECRVDAVKFQLFKPEKLVTDIEPVLPHVPDKREKTQRERFRRMALSNSDMDEVVEYCKAKQIDFLCTPFDLDSLDYISDKVPFVKIASGDADYRILIEAVVDLGLPIAVSTGMLGLKQIDRLVSWLPSEKSAIMHCVSSYPTPDISAHLSVIDLLKNRYSLPIGYSCHTPDGLACLVAAAKGVSLIEKHFILTKTLPAGDRAVSLEPSELAELVTKVRRISCLQGENCMDKVDNDAELANKRALRRTPYFNRDLKAGDVVRVADLDFVRPYVAGTVKLPTITQESSWYLKKDVSSGEPFKQSDIREEWS